jgi:hypothetical protein
MTEKWRINALHRPVANDRNFLPIIRAFLFEIHFFKVGPAASSQDTLASPAVLTTFRRYLSNFHAFDFMHRIPCRPPVFLPVLPVLWTGRQTHPL